MNKFGMYNAATMKDEKDKNYDEETEVVPEEHGEDAEIRDDEAAEELMGMKLKALRSKLKECEETKAKTLEDLQRARADFLNSKRRIEEQAARDSERTAIRIITDLLPLLDSFDTALSDVKRLHELDPTWRSGIEGIHALLKNFLRAEEVTEIETLGKHFNPHEHEAISNTPVDDNAAVDTVISVLQKGYKWKDVVIRPAKVAVGIKKEQF